MVEGQREVKTGGTILLVEDQLDSIRTLSSLLAYEGYRVRKATNGQMALETVEIEKPDLILLDIKLPDMSGYEVCQTIKASETTQDIPVIFLSSLDGFPDKATAFAIGGADYITKPFQVEEILIRVNNQLTLYRQQQQLLLQNALLKQAEAKYRSIFENATEGIYQITPDGQFLNVNPALARLYGYPSPEELITSVTDIGRQLYVQPERWEHLRLLIQVDGSVSETESEVYQKDGSTIWITENIWMVRDTQGNALYYEGTVEDITKRRQMETELRQQRWRAERLLVNVLPQKIAQRLKINPQAIADSFDEVTVMFADLVDFTTASAETSPKQLVKLLNQIFSAFDQLSEQYGLEKIKTIGDAYMVAAGLPTPRPDHARAMALMALDMQQTITQFHRPDGTPFQLRIGINTGAVVAGVIGTKKFIYDLWGDTVNVASRMESTGEPGRIQVSANTYERLKKKFIFEERGAIPIKGKGEMVTYWLVESQSFIKV